MKERKPAPTSADVATDFCCEGSYVFGGSSVFFFALGLSEVLFDNAPKAAELGRTFLEGGVAALAPAAIFLGSAAIANYDRTIDNIRYFFSANKQN
jgi:hypothetical protein